ncbi:cytochrome C oxidase assembly protein [Pacificibacter sp. AS14]|uniref:cytochrome C oxidase assembly protein n=1 Tax=Pacificibacter sp. AS14 TaxID=3135785 RepID=UPI00317DCA6E
MAITKLHEIHTRRKSRNVGLGLVLATFVVLILGLTVVKVTTTPISNIGAAEAHQ